MPTPEFFPIPIPELTRVNTLDKVETAPEDLAVFLKQFIALVILDDFAGKPSPPVLLKIANKLCTQIGALPQQQVLWIPDPDMVAAVKPALEAVIQAGFPNKTFAYENIAALAVEPVSGRAVYLIFKDPSLSPDPEDSGKNLSALEMQIAFNTAIILLPKTHEI